jgi:hypothetical protein
LVNGGILLMPQKEKLKGRFHLPYINAKYIFPIFFIGGLVGFIFGNQNFFIIYGIFQMSMKVNSDFLSSFLFY